MELRYKILIALLMSWILVLHAIVTSSFSRLMDDYPKSIELEERMNLKLINDSLKVKMLLNMVFVD